MDVDRALVDFRRQAPHAVEQLRAREDAAGLAIRYSSSRNSVGPRWTSRPPRCTRQFSRSSSRSPAVSASRRGRAGAAQQRAHARHQLRHGERLDDVIVGAGRQAAHALALLAARRQHDDRQRARRRARAQAAADLEAGDAGQHPVEDDEVGRRLEQPQFGLVAALDALDGEALRLEIVGEQQAQRVLVLDDEDARRGAGRRAFARRLTAVMAPRSSAGCASARRASLRPLHRQRLAGDEIDHRLGDVGGMVADALDVLGAEQQVRAEGDVARILHHEGEEVAEHASPRARRARRRASTRRAPLGVALGVGVEHVLQLRWRRSRAWT